MAVVVPGLHSSHKDHTGLPIDHKGHYNRKKVTGSHYCQQQQQLIPIRTPCCYVANSCVIVCSLLLLFRTQ